MRMGPWKSKGCLQNRLRADVSNDVYLQGARNGGPDVALSGTQELDRFSSQISMQHHHMASFDAATSRKKSWGTVLKIDREVANSGFKH